MLPFEQLTIEMIKNIIREHKSLKEENEVLKKRNKEVKSERKNHIDVIDYLRYEVATLTNQSKKCSSKLLRKEEKLEMELMEIDGLKWDNDRLEKENIALKEEVKALKAQAQKVEEESYFKDAITPEEAWENFKTSKEKLWRSCFFECSEFEFYPKNIQYWEWSVRNEDGDIIEQGDKKPKKQDILSHWRNGITIRLYAFNDREEWTLITHFNGQEWVYEDAVI